MSELKATTVYDAYWKANSVGEGTGILVYLKSEADKVIADLEESNKMEVEQLLILNREQANAANRLRDSMERVIRHNKYKRCLKNREICVMRCDIEFARQYPTRASFWMKWERKWLELAEQFKEGV